MKGLFNLRFIMGAVAATACAAASAQIGWTMRGFNTNRTGNNQSETVLNQSNVNTGQFGLIFTRPVDGQIYAQPLVVPKVVIPNKGTFDVVYVATEHDSVYAFDADNASNPQPLWHRSFIDPANGVTSIPYYWLTGEMDIHPEVGITGTPAVDTVNGILYVVVRTLEGDPNNDSSYVQRLWGLDLKTGATKLGPVVLAAAVTGSGSGNNNNSVFYDNRRNNQRPALVLANGKLYITAASHGDNPPYHGWVLCYDAATLKLLSYLCTTPNGYDGGIWMSGQGMPVDAAGNLYVTTGNGDWNLGANDYGDSVLKLNGSTLKIEDYFTPWNQASLDQQDNDLGVAGPILLPGTAYAVQGSKEGKLYLLNTNNLGKFNAAGDTQIVQWWQACESLIYAPPVYWQGGSNGNNLYVWSALDVLKGYSFNGKTFNTSPFANAATYVANPGGMLTVSSNGANASTALVWATSPYTGDANQTTVPGILHVFNAENLNEIWNSHMVPGDDFGNFAKFNPPVVVNGKVYVPTFSNQLAVYGLLPHEAPTAPALSAEAGDQEVELVWQGTHGVTGYVISRGPVGGPYTKVATVSATTNTYDDTDLTDGTTYAYRVVAQGTYGSSPASNEASATPTRQTVPTTPNGLTGYYYIDSGNGNFFTTLGLRRIDPVVDFDWGGGSPGGTMPSSNFSAIWYGTLVAPATGYYTFKTTSDDGVQLFVRGRQVINDWTYHAPTDDYSTPTLLIKGKSYPIQLEYFQGGGGDLIHLYWSVTGSGNYSVIPSTSLFTYPTTIPTYDASQDLTGNYTLDGMSYLSDPTDGDIGILRETFASELMPTTSTFSLSSIPFILGPGYNGALNIVECDGQTINLPAYGATLAYVVGCSIGGSQEGTFTLNYNDGSNSAQNVTFTDWSSAKALNGETLAKNFKLRHNPAGNLNANASIFRYAIPVSSAKKLISITLPNNPEMKVLALSVYR